MTRLIGMVNPMRLVFLAGIATVSSMMVGPASADCVGSPGLITTQGQAGRSQIFTEWFRNHPDFFYNPYGSGAAVYCGAYNGCTPLSPAVRGSFWQLGAGDTTIGAGNDNGTFDLVAAGHLGWGGFPSYGYYFGANLTTDWDNGTDGCIGEDNCLSVLLTDQIEGVAYFAVMTARSSAGFWTTLEQGGVDGSGYLDRPIILVPLPAPVVDATLGVTVNVPPLAGPDDGLYYKDGCDDAVAGYHVYGLTQSAGGPVPTDLDRTSWQLLTTDPVPLGTDATVPYFCFVGQEGYVAISLVFDSGFETHYVSAPTTSPMLCCASDADGDGSCDNLDCAPNDPDVHARAAEVCNGADDNCNGLIDDDALGEDADADFVHAACDNCPTIGNPTQLDSDSDTHGDACDNCIFLANTDQDNADGDNQGDVCDPCTDIDGDGFGDRGFPNVCAIDNCPQIPNPSQANTDADFLGDDCDNCVAVANPSQSDWDADAEGDLCDTDDGVITTSFTDTGTLQWDMEAGFTLWNAYRGSLSKLVADPSTHTQQLMGSNPDAARMCGLAVTLWIDPDDPASGTVAYYLTTGIDGLGAESGLGSDSDGVIRNNGNACP